MACSDAFGTPAQFATLFACGELTEGEAEQWQAALDLTAGNIHAVLAQNGGCDCTLASWATNYLAKLNVIEAVLLKQCGCGGQPLTDDEKKSLFEMLQAEYDRIIKGEIDVCQNATGVNYPAVDIIQQALTPWSAGQIVINRLRRQGW